MADLDATISWARSQGATDAVAITGFCWGGRISWLYAAHQPAIRAAVAWYGRLTGTSTELQPQHPVDLAADLKAPVLGLYGGLDRGIPLQDVRQMRRALEQEGVSVAAHHGLWCIPRRGMASMPTIALPIAMWMRVLRSPNVVCGCVITASRLIREMLECSYVLIKFLWRSEPSHYSIEFRYRLKNAKESVSSAETAKANHRY